MSVFQVSEFCPSPQYRYHDGCRKIIVTVRQHDSLIFAYPDCIKKGRDATRPHCFKNSQNPEFTILPSFLLPHPHSLITHQYSHQGQ
jgi:hypothetical protein